MKLVLCLLPLHLITVSAISQNTANQNNIALNTNGREVWNNMIALHNQVFGSKNGVIINSLLSPQLQYGHSNGKVENLKTMVENATGSATLYQNVHNKLLSLHFLGNTAMARVELSATSITNGVETPLHLAILQVWGKQKGQWLLLERQAVKIPPEQ